MIAVYTTRNVLEHGADRSEADWQPGTTLLDVLPEWAREEADVRVLRDGVHVPPEDWALPIPEGARIDVIQSPGFAFSGLALAGIKYGAALAAKSIATKAFLVAAVKLAGIFAVNWAVSSLLAPRKRPVQEGQDDSSTYGFSGIRSVREAEGAAVPVVYGEHLTSGVIINRFVRLSISGSELYTLLLLSEGPVESIGGRTTDNGFQLSSEQGTLPAGLLINGQPAEDFDYVEAHVRLGSNNQDPIPGFANAEQTLEVGLALDESANLPTDPTITPQSGGFDPGDSGDLAELDKWDTVEVYTMAEEADEFGIVLNFPQGLYAVSGGGIGVESAEFQIRYRELDGGGTPTGNYLVLPAEPVLQAAQAGNYRAEFSHEFLDVSTYSAPGIGERLELDGATGYVEVDTPTGIPATPVAQVKFSMAVWVYPTMEFPSVPGSGATTDSYVLSQQFNANFGWRAVLDLKTTRVSGETVRHDAQLVMTYGNGSTTQAYTRTLYTKTATGTGAPPPVDTFTDKWNHIAVAVDASQAGTNTFREFVWINGVRLADTNRSFAFNTSPLANIYVGDYPSSSEDPFEGYMDAFKVFSRNLSEANYQQEWNSGNGFNGAGNEPDLDVALFFDGEVSGVTPDSSPKGNDGDLQTGATISTGAAGKVEGLGFGTRKRGRYRIEIQRLDAEATGLGSNAATWDTVRLTTFEDFTYPGRALLAVKIRSDGEVGQGEPQIQVPVKGDRCPVWDGGSTTTPNAPLTWSSNPAWVTLDALTNQIYGLDEPFALTEIDLPAWLEWATYCDEFVPTGGEELSDFFVYYQTSPNEVWLYHIRPEGIPDGWEVGEYVSLEGVGAAAYNLGPTGGYQINAITFESVTVDSVTADGVLIKLAFPAGFTAPTAGFGSGVYTETATAALVERRFELDTVLDRRDADAWSTIVSMMKSARATPILNGSKLSLFVDKAASPVATISMSNVVEGSFSLSWVNQTDRPNSASAEILDRDDGYRRALPEYEHPSVNDPTKFSSFRRRRYALEGTTRKSQALRHLKYELNVHYLLRRQLEWQMEVDGIQLKPGDVVRVAHDMPGWSPSGLFRSGCTPDELYLDRPVSVPTGDFELLWIPRGTGTAQTITDATPDGDYAAGEVIELGTALTNGVPSEGDAWVLTAEIPYRLFRVISLDLDPQTLKRRCVAIEYNADVYDDDFGTLLHQPAALPVPGSGAEVLATPAPPGVQQLEVSTYSHESEDGGLSSYVELSWLPGPNQGTRTVDRHEIFLTKRIDNLRPESVIKWGEVPGNIYRARFPIEGFDSATQYLWGVRTVGRNGARRRLLNNPYTAWSPPARTAPRRTNGSTWPSEPRDGDRHYDTAAQEWFYWDDTREAWLGEAALTLIGGKSANWNVGVGLFISGAASTSSYGYTFPYDTRLVGASVNVKSGSHTGTIRIYAAASQIGVLNLSSGTQASADGLDGQAAADTPIWAVLTGASISPASNLVLIFRREGNA
jgi:hypothetical protein